MNAQGLAWQTSSVDFISDDDLYNKGCMYYTQGDTVSAAKCFQKAAKSGDNGGLYLYGLFKIGGMGGVKANPKAGLRMIQQAAANGESGALCFLGGIYERGEYGYSVNKTEALHLYKKASQAGSLDGHVACGNYYYVNGDTAMAIEYWSKAIELADHLLLQDYQRTALAQITYNLGWFSHYGCGAIQSIYDAAAYYQQSVLYGNTKDAAFQLGMIYLDGVNTFEPDQKLATYYLEMAAMAGQTEACVCMGDLLRLSDSDEQALHYYLAGAQGGNENAMYCLASMYFERKEYDSAVYWASQCPNNVLAIYLLGWVCYMQHDFTQAKHFWQQCVYYYHFDDALTVLKKLSSGVSLDGYVSL